MGARRFRAEVSDVLARSGPPPALELPEGYLLRNLGADADWDGAFLLGMKISQEGGFAFMPRAPLLRRGSKGRLEQAASGTLRSWSAFRDREPAAAMCVVAGRIEGASIAPYQAIETDPEHRRRGLCAALLARAARGALEREPDARLVIVADADDMPARLYRRAGLSLAERAVAVVRGPDATP